MKDKNKYIDIDFAKLDIDREKRRGYSEAIFCECKTNEQLIEIFSELKNKNKNIIGTRASFEQYQALKTKFDNINYHKEGRILTLIQNEIKKQEKLQSAPEAPVIFPLQKKLL